MLLLLKPPAEPPYFLFRCNYGVIIITEGAEPAVVFLSASHRNLNHSFLSFFTRLTDFLKSYFPALYRHHSSLRSPGEKHCWLPTLDTSIDIYKIIFLDRRRYFFVLFCGQFVLVFIFLN